MKYDLSRTVWVGFFALSLPLLGCKTADHAGEGYQASVVIAGHDAAAIREMTTKVFLENGYQQAAGLVFEKKGSRWNSLAYGGWGGQPVWVRVRVSLRPHGPGQHVLGGDAYFIRDRGAGFMEEEQKLSVSKRGECEKILNTIKARLAAGESPASPVP